jgi:hypothetical protein
MSVEQRKKLLAWLWVGLCILAIFLVVPTARTIQRLVSAAGGRSLFGYAVLVATGLVFFSLLYILIFRLKVRAAANYVWLTAVAGLYVYFTLRLWRNPEEAVHFLEYGLLGYLLFRALSLTIRDASIYPSAFLIGSLVGIGDEILQWMMPNRYWDFRDAGLNALAAGLIQVAIWKGLRPRVISAKTGPRSWRRVSVLLAANLLLLGLCASNTPRRVARYAERVPRLSFLVREEPMSEFTLRHLDPEIGVFYSRLSLAELQREDSKNSGHYGRILRDWKDKSYAEFLSRHHPLIHAFLYEMRVHLFRRDRRLQEGREAKSPRARKNDLFVAYKENLILEKYFGRTLEQSSYQWEPEERASVASLIDQHRAYRSPVSAGRFQVKETTLWLAIFVLLAVLAAANILIGRKKRRTS